MGDRHVGDSVDGVVESGASEEEFRASASFSDEVSSEFDSREPRFEASESSFEEEDSESGDSESEDSESGVSDLESLLDRPASSSPYWFAAFLTAVWSAATSGYFAATGR